MISSVHHLKYWLKNSPSPIARFSFGFLKSCLSKGLPIPLAPYFVLHVVVKVVGTLTGEIMRLLWWTPLFKTRLAKRPKHLYLYSGMPYLSGALNIEMGENCRISGQTTFTGRCGINPHTQKPVAAQLIIGNNAGISWQTTIAVGDKVIIGNNVRIAGRCFLAGYPGHPVNPYARAQGKPDTDDQIGSIVLEENVWLGTGCTVLAGVTIGCNTIVGSGSIVTKNLPPNVIAAGNPARVIRPLTCAELTKEDVNHGAL